MIRDSINIEIVWKVNTDVFRQLNGDLFGTSPKRLGPNTSIVQKMLSYYEDMQRVLMPGVISVSPNDPAWYKRISDYWNSISPMIPLGGRSLQVGFEYDINDESRKHSISIIQGKAKIETDEALAEYVKKNISDDLKYKYGKPINAEDYLFYIYCLNHRKVANSIEDANKSTNIEFLLVDQRLVDETRKKNHTIRMAAKQKFIEILNDRQIIRDILYIRGRNSKVMDSVTQDMEVSNFSETDPTGFLKLLEDKTFTTKARVERYIIAGVIERLANSSIIVDSNDKNVIIGMTTDEAVAYFNAEAADKVAKVKELAARYKSKTSNE